MPKEWYLLSAFLLFFLSWILSKGTQNDGWGLGGPLARWVRLWRDKDKGLTCVSDGISRGWSWDLTGFLYCVRYCIRGVMSTSLQVFYRWGSEMISNLPNVSLERPETNSKLGLSTPESTFFCRPRPAHPVNLKSPLRSTCASQLAFCTDPSYDSVSIRSLSSNHSLSLCGHFPHPYPLISSSELIAVLYPERALKNSQSGPSLCS